eukprot:4370279-Pleurochrysis_carterae.AAC.1
MDGVLLSFLWSSILRLPAVLSLPEAPVDLDAVATCLAPLPIPEEMLCMLIVSSNLQRARDSDRSAPTTFCQGWSRFLAGLPHALYWLLALVSTSKATLLKLLLIFALLDVCVTIIQANKTDQSFENPDRVWGCIYVLLGIALIASTAATSVARDIDSRFPLPN